MLVLWFFQPIFPLSIFFPLFHFLFPSPLPQMLLYHLFLLSLALCFLAARLYYYYPSPVFISVEPFIVSYLLFLLFLKSYILSLLLFLYFLFSILFSSYRWLTYFRFSYFSHLLTLSFSFPFVFFTCMCLSLRMYSCSMVG